MARRKRKTSATVIAGLPVIRRRDDVLEPVYEADPDGRPVVHHRTVDTLGIMLRSGTITREMHDAARDFQAQFTIARYDTLVCMRFERDPSKGNRAELTETQIDARRRVDAAMDALGGLGSPAGGCVWHVVGLQRSVREWAMRQGWGGRPINEKHAQGNFGRGAGGVGGVVWVRPKLIFLPAGLARPHPPSYRVTRVSHRRARLLASPGSLTHLLRAVLTISLLVVGQIGNTAMPLSLTSSGFSHGGAIPKRYTCEGSDVSPPLAWSGVPEGTKSLALVVDDPDAPDPKAPKMTWVHWVLYNLAPTASALPEGVEALPAGTGQGLNDWKRPGYGGPCPPIGRHRYFHKLYALDTVFTGLGIPTKSTLLEAMEGHVLAQAELVGTYEKSAR